MGKLDGRVEEEWNGSMGGEKIQFLRNLIRLFLYWVGGLVALAAIYAMFAWVLIHRPQQVMSMVGVEWARRLTAANARVMERIFSGDRDHDGICDGLEMVLRSDPQKADVQGYVLEPDGMRMSVYDARNIGVELHAGEHRDQLLEPGERRTVRIQLVNLNSDFFGWSVVSRHLRVRIHPSPSSLVGAPGGVVSGSPMDLPVESGGILVFDLQAQSGEIPKAVPRKRIEIPPPVPGVPGLDPMPDGKFDDLFERTEFETGEQIDLRNADTGDEIGQFRFRRAWRRPPINPTVEILSRPDDSIENTQLLYRWDAYRTARLSWPGDDGADSGYLLEIAADEPEANWFAIQVYPARERSAIVAHHLQSDRFPYHGPLKYRIVPLRREPVQP